MLLSLVDSRGAPPRISVLGRITAYSLMVIGAILGTVSLAGVLYFGSALLDAAPSNYTGDPAASQNLLLAAIHALGVTFAIFGGIADSIIKGLAIASLVALFISIVLILIGRGLCAAKRWSKIGAAVIVPIILLSVALLATILAAV